MAIALRHKLGTDRHGINLTRQRTTTPAAATTGTLLDDAFTGTIGTNLEAHTADSGQSWAVSPGAGSANTHQLSGTGTVYRVASPQAYLLGPAISKADYRVDLILNVKSVITNDFSLIYARAVDANNSYRIEVDTNQITLDKLISGAKTVLGPGSFSNVLTTGSHTVSLIVAGTSISAYWDSTLIIGPVTDSTYTSAGKAGLRIGSTSVTQTTTTGIHGDRFTVTG